jgi:UDP-N-acetylmuramyl tripeptide synthase
MIILNSFTYVGPNRRNDIPVQEVSFVLTENERAQLRKIFADLPDMLFELNNLWGIKQHFKFSIAAENPMGAGLASLFATQALMIQSAAGHIVFIQGLAADDKLADAQCYFEFDDPDTAVATTEFCKDLFSQLINGTTQDLDQLAATLAPKLNQLIEDAKPKATPADTRAILDAASFRGIPWLKLEKTGLSYHDGDFRLRKNSLLNLGQGCNRTMIDATFCVDRSMACFELIRDREKLQSALSVLELPQPKRDMELGARNSVTRILRTAERIGYPVSIKTSRRRQGLDSIHKLINRSELEAAAEKLLAVERSILVESWVAGNRYRILVANTRLMAVLRAEQKNTLKWVSESTQLHPDTLTVIAKIANYFPVGIMEIHLVAEDISRALTEQSGAVVDVRLAPALDDLAVDHPDLLKRTALAFVDWIYPDPAKARIPLIAVTGTNGKTSTCRMIDRAYRLANYTTGLTCTDGFYVGDQLINEGDFAGFPGHLSLINAAAIQVAILETARGGVAQMGLGFDRCDVGVCLNVTEDHLGQYSINTLEDLTRLKFSIMSRAKKAVVLNADNRPSLSMKNQLSGQRVCLVSITHSLETLSAAHTDVNCFALLESRDGQEWLVIHDKDQTIPVIAVADMPVAMGGAARHYIANGLHAAAACHLNGLAIEVIREALATYKLSFDMAPGRLNIHKGRGITAIMDFAQNPDSLRELINFIDTLPVTGRRLLGLSCSANNTDELIRATAAEAAGKFDHYVCKNFKLSEERTPDEVPRLLSEGLLSRGVDASVISQITDPMGAVAALFDMAQEGDLVVLMTGRVHRKETWEMILDRLS